ncbi:MAG: synthetase [Solirubrobacterales bacterium]|nr:synthetase [Solirubrobacterales bacterium]
MRLALCQMNATVGDIAGNSRRIRDGANAARDAGAQLVLFPELAITGYPPEDLLLKEHFLADAATALRELARDISGIVAVVGFPERAEDVYNSAAVLADGSVAAIYRKVYLPNYGVFDEQRYFQAGRGGAVLDVGAERIGLSVCEDLWEPGPPASDEALAGATLIVNISASPYHAGKGVERERMFAQRARDNLACVAFCALVGGQDELVFDGHSVVIDHTGTTIARARQFDEELLVCDVDLSAAAAARLRDAGHRPAARRAERTAEILRAIPAAAEAVAPASAPARAPGIAELLAPIEAEVYAALKLGLRDYVEKNGFEQVVLGVSGGIDSALVACLAVDALGAGRVNAAVMPSPYSSSETQQDARRLGAALGIRVHELSIGSILDAYLQTLRAQLSSPTDSSGFVGAGGAAARGEDLTEENLQARIRGNLLMALSNKFGWLVLATGNKSEMSVGYTTLYGDLAGGFAVIKDVPKTLVYRICRWRNSPAGAGAGSAAAGASSVESPIPDSILQRAPSAELRRDQRDEDSLPPYDVLDRILQGYIELDRSREQLIAQGLPEHYVDLTIRLVDRAEYKRRQAPPGIKITTRAFGRDRRMPITNRYRG